MSEEKRYRHAECGWEGTEEEMRADFSGGAWSNWICPGCGAWLRLDDYKAMTKTWSSMTDRERNAALAVLIGWTCQEEEGFWPNKEQVWRDASGQKVAALSSTSSLDAMRLVEGVIEGRELWRRYTKELGDLAIAFDDLSDDGTTAMWRLIRATPAQRAEAAWRVLGAKENA